MIAFIVLIIDYSRCLYSDWLPITSTIFTTHDSYIYGF